MADLTGQDKNMESNKSCELSVKSFIKIMCHAMKFNANKANGKNICAYGLLVGNNKGSNILIKDIEPIRHYQGFNFEFDEEFIKDMDDFNHRFVDEDSPDRIIGWYKTINPPMKFRAIDVKNQLKFQALNPGNIALLFDYSIFSEGKGYGFSIFSLKKDRFGDINFMSEHFKIPWTIKTEDSDRGGTILYVKELIGLSAANKDLIKELDEI